MFSLKKIRTKALLLLLVLFSSNVMADSGLMTQLYSQPINGIKKAVTLGRPKVFKSLISFNQTIIYFLSFEKNLKQGWQAAVKLKDFLRALEREYLFNNKFYITLREIEQEKKSGPLGENLEGGRVSEARVLLKEVRELFLRVVEKTDRKKQRYQQGFGDYKRNLSVQNKFKDYHHSQEAVFVQMKDKHSFFVCGAI